MSRSQDWRKERGKAAQHARLMANDPGLCANLHGIDPEKMTPAMRRLWVKPLTAVNPLERARRREFMLDSENLYPARAPVDRLAHSRNSETEET